MTAGTPPGRPVSDPRAQELPSDADREAGGLTSGSSTLASEH